MVKVFIANAANGHAGYLVNNLNYELFMAIRLADSLMVSRCTISSKQREILVKKFLEDGMKGCSSSTLAVRQAAAVETGLSIQTINHWINNYKKRGEASSGPPTSASCPSKPITRTAKLLNSKRLRKASAFNKFSKEFHQQEGLRGKTLAEKSKLMAETWRSMGEKDKEKYEADALPDEEALDLPPQEKKKRIFRVARRLQGDATQLESAGCEMATLMFIDGQTVTVGSKKGKEFLRSHPAFLTCFNAHFLYDDLTKQQPTLTSTVSDSATLTGTSSAPLNASKQPARTSMEQKDDLTKQQPTLTSTVSDSATRTGTSSTPLNASKPPASTSMEQKEKMFIKSSDGSICAIGFVLQEQQVIHGHPLREGNAVVSIKEIVQVGAKSYYPDRFGEDDLQKGALVEWPLKMISRAADPSPMHTRKKSKKKGT